jgi:hypothetical protein
MLIGKVQSELIENCCRTRDWIWASVTGDSFHYFETREYCNMQSVGYSHGSTQTSYAKAGSNNI